MTAKSTTKIAKSAPYENYSPYYGSKMMMKFIIRQPLMKKEILGLCIKRGVKFNFLKHMKAYKQSQSIIIAKNQHTVYIQFIV